MIGRRKDDIAWVKVTNGKDELLFFLTEPFLYPNIASAAAKLIYANRKPFPEGNIEKHSNEVTWYSTVSRLQRNGVYSLSDPEILEVSKRFGILPADKIDSNLASLARLKIREISWTPSSEGAIPNVLRSKTLDTIEKFYGVPIKSIRITGSIHAFGCNPLLARDIDLVIPVPSLEIAGFIAESLIPKHSIRVREYGLKWPLRWHYRDDRVICPFFIYGEIPLPVEKVAYTGETLNSVLEIRDDSLGIFNMPIYFVGSPVDLLIVRPRFVRGFIRRGKRISVRAPIYQIIAGSARGLSAAVVTNLTDQIVGFERDILCDWRS